MKNQTSPATSLWAVGKSPFSLIVAIILLPMITLLEAQPAKPSPPQDSLAAETSTEPQAVVTAVRGKCEYSEDGANFIDLKADQVLKEGVFVRTGEEARTDIFFRRIGTTVRLQPDTEMKIEKMARRLEGDKPVMNTLLDLKKGRIFTVVRSYIPGSIFEVRNAAGRSVVEGGGKNGRYIITADGTSVADKNSDTPLKVVGEKGVTVITPGQKFLAKEGKLLAEDPPEAVSLLIEFDEIHALAEKLEQPQKPK